MDICAIKIFNPFNNILKFLKLKIAHHYLSTIKVHLANADRDCIPLPAGYYYKVTLIGRRAIPLTTLNHSTYILFKCLIALVPTYFMQNK